MVRAEGRVGRQARRAARPDELPADTRSSRPTPTTRAISIPGPAVKDVPLVDGAAGEPGGDQGVRPARIRAADRRARRSRVPLEPEPDGRGLPTLGRGDRRRQAQGLKQVAIDRRQASGELAASTASRRASASLNAPSTTSRPHDRAAASSSPCSARPVRQVDGAQLHRRPAAATGRRHLARRAAASTRCGRSSAASAWCSRTTRLFPHMSVRREYRLRADDAAACPRTRSRAASTRRSTWSGCRAQADKLPGQLSGGQQQRVAIARAIVDRAAARADGRAAVEPRRQAAARDAGRDPAHPQDARRARRST